MSLAFRPTRILVVVKTYPELSGRHTETVCTAGCLEDGRPVRLYPVPFRYLTGDKQYRAYQWIEVPVATTPRDRRPESLKIRPESIVVGDLVGTEHGWAARRAVVFKDSSWHFGCLDELKALQKRSKRSLGVVKVGAVDEVTVEPRPLADAVEHKRKLAQLVARQDLFVGATKGLDFVPFRIRIRWRCAEGSRCPGHGASVLDWGLLELARREGGETARRKLEAIADPTRFDFRLFMGNLAARQHVFSCIGLWYPRLEPAGAQVELAFG